MQSLRVRRSESLRLGFVPRTEAAQVFKPLIDNVVKIYLRYHPEIRAIYLLGSISIGEHVPGLSDLDVIGIAESPADTDSDSQRRHDLTVLGTASKDVTFVDNNVLNLQDLDEGEIGAIGKARLLSISGICVWGDPIDFSSYMPTVGTMADERTQRARALMAKYRRGDLIEPFKRDERLLIRSCAKAAMRVLSCITILRGELFYTSPEQTYTAVLRCAPEAYSIAEQAITIIRGGAGTVDHSMSLCDQSLELYDMLFPDLARVKMQ